jgi:hypothetical protein
MATELIPNMEVMELNHTCNKNDHYAEGWIDGDTGVLKLPQNM